jgi:uncharacterized coiled-coil protein SlyX
MIDQFRPESTPTPSEVNLTDEQKKQLEELNNTLNKLQYFINNNPGKIPNLINRFFNQEEKILPNGQKVFAPSEYERLIQLLREADPSFVPVSGWRNKEPLSSTPPSTPFPLNENPNSLSSTPQTNLKK